MHYGTMGTVLNKRNSGCPLQGGSTLIMVI